MNQLCFIAARSTAAALTVASVPIQRLLSRHTKEARTLVLTGSPVASRSPACSARNEHNNRLNSKRTTQIGGPFLYVGGHCGGHRAKFS